MKKITYGAPNLVDWVAQIKAGAATVRVHFTGGALTSYGVTPAEYTTENPFIQRVIEKSSYFKEGRITTVRSCETESPVKSDKPVNKPKAVTKVEAAPTVVVTDVSDVTNVSDVAPGDFEGVEVSCLQDAQAYLQEKFSISSYKVRTCEAAQRAASEHGVRFTGAKFDTLNESKPADVTAEETE